MHNRKHTFHIVSFLLLQSTVFLHVSGFHIRIKPQIRTVKPFSLQASCTQNPLPDTRTALSRRPLQDIPEFQGFHLHTNINPVQNRTGHSAQIPLHFIRRTTTSCHIRIISAGTRIHSPNQHKIRRKSIDAAAPRNLYPPVFQRLAQDVQRLPFKFRQLVQEKDTAVAQTDNPRNRYSAASRQRLPRYRMMGTQEWPSRNQCLLCRMQQSRYTVDRRYLQTFLQ